METAPFHNFLGAEITRREGGVARFVLELAPHHTNRLGVAHGGVISALLDSAMGTAVLSAIPEGQWMVTTSLSIHYMGSAKKGRLIAEGRIVRRSDRIAFTEGEVRNSGGKLLATACGTYHLWWLDEESRPEQSGPHMLMRDGEPLRVGKILGIGRNYADHIEEMGAPASGPPVIFLKPASAIIHDGGEIHLPEGVGEVHHEVELVVAIGRSGKEIREKDALDHVLGYAVGLDMTLRDLQGRAKERGEPWSLAKGFDSSAPLSPVVPRDEVGDGSGLRITLDVNGERRQEGSTSQMLRTVAELIALASRLMTLERGDLLYTGTPAGVGPVKSGDTLRAELEKVGSLTVTVV